MEECCSHKVWGWKLLVLGLVIILVRLCTAWDIWVVLGVIVAIKGLWMLLAHMNHERPAKTRKR
jgi:hypothetical protein